MEKEEKLVIGGIVAVFLLAICLPMLASVSNTDVVTATVSDKTVKRSGESDQYLVFTDKETFCVTDSLYHGQFRSSDLYGRLKVGETYTFKVFGWRIPFFSQYRTIYQVEKK